MGKINMAYVKRTYVNSVDRQNFEAVIHLTDTSTLQILDTIPDAKATQQNVLLNSKTPLENSETGLLQILHVNNNHWAALSYINNNISYYDSSYSTLSPTTKQVIANLFHLQHNASKLNILLKDVSHQSGIVDCGLYAIAYITSIAYGNDPSALVFCQEMLRSHWS